MWRAHAKVQRRKENKAHHPQIAQRDADFKNDRGKAEGAEEKENDKEKEDGWQ
jgi:hypothetical protein